MNLQQSSSTAVVPRRQAGFSLIELMIAIVIAMVVTAGAIAVFGNMRSSFISQDKLGQLQDGQRLALTVLNTTVQSAGYFPRPDLRTVTDTFPATSATPNKDGTSFLVEGGIVGSGTFSGTASNVLNVRYSGSTDDGVMNCLGERFTKSSVTIPADVIVNTFEVINNQLTCRINGGTAVALVDNVSSMKLQYLVDKGGTYAYMDAPTVAAGSYWGTVSAVRITLQFMDPFNAGADLPYKSIQIINLMNKNAS